jgi:hypothetical protein
MCAEEKALDNAKAREGMARHRYISRTIREQSSIPATFECTHLWDRPGRDYKLDSYRHSPEASALAWYASNGSWRDREALWLIAYLRARESLQEMDDTALARLDSLYLHSVKYNASFIRVVHENFTKDDWRIEEMWRGSQMFTQPEMAALVWYALYREIAFGVDEDHVDESDGVQDDDRSYRTLGYVRDKDKWSHNVDVAWAESLIGLRMMVPDYWWEGYTGQTKRSGWIEGINPSEKKKRNFMLMLDDPKWRGPFPMAYEDLLKFVDKDQEGYKEFRLPREEPARVPNEDYHRICEETLRGLKETPDVLSHHAIKRLEQIFGEQKLTPKREKELGKQFLKAQGRGVFWGTASFGDGQTWSVDAPLFACACCGMRKMVTDGKEQYRQVPLRELEVLRLGYDERLRHHERVLKGSIQVPTGNRDREGNALTRDIEPWRAFSVWPVRSQFDYEEGEELYHLHPEFVVGEGLDAKATLCASCCDDITDGLVPEYSVANGVDFGDCRRLGLEPLTTRERQIISKVRHYYTVIKIESKLEGCESIRIQH